eukprot:PhM_4_TR5947/c0_g1_i1/m.5778/K13179/DDX18, HAS1; ATP-dependent RNA helicase DDX18/HAS1
MGTKGKKKQRRLQAYLERQQAKMKKNDDENDDVPFLRDDMLFDNNNNNHNNNDNNHLPLEEDDLDEIPLPKTRSQIARALDDEAMAKYCTHRGGGGGSGGGPSGNKHQQTSALLAKREADKKKQEIAKLVKRTREEEAALMLQQQQLEGDDDDDDADEPAAKKTASKKKSNKQQLLSTSTLSDATASTLIHHVLLNESTALTNFTHLTKIQAAAIPVVRAGYNAVVHAPTGSGKTLAYLLPVLSDHIDIIESGADEGLPPVMLVVVPTKELAVQIHGVAAKLLPDPALAALITGGASMRAEQTLLRGEKGKAHPWVIIATPGRLAHHVGDEMEAAATTPGSWVHRVRVGVLDEADRLLEPSFAIPLSSVLSKILHTPSPMGMQYYPKHKTLPPHRQILLFSATSTRLLNDITDLIPTAKRDGQTLFVSTLTPHPVRVDNGEAVPDPLAAAAAAASGKKQKSKKSSEDEAAAPDAEEGDVSLVPQQLTQTYVMVPRPARLCALYAILKHAQKLGEKVVVFCSTCASAIYHCMLMGSVGFHDEVLMLHGDMKHRQRVSTFEIFNEEPGRILFTTDVAARGLDVPDVAFVVQYDPPVDPASYIHRIGRTARAHREGRAVILLDPAEIGFVSYLRTTGGLVKLFEDKELHALIHKHRFDELQMGFEGVLEEDPLVARAAKRAYTAFVHGYQSHTLGDIFKASNLDLEDVACSFALVDAPVVSLKKNDSVEEKEQKKKAYTKGKVRSMLKKINAREARVKRTSRGKVMGF